MSKIKRKKAKEKTVLKALNPVVLSGKSICFVGIDILLKYIPKEGRKKSKFEVHFPNGKIYSHIPLKIYLVDKVFHLQKPLIGDCLDDNFKESMEKYSQREYKTQIYYLSDDV